MKDILKAVVFGGLFAIPFLTLYVENDYFFPFITGKNFWFRIIVEIVLAAWVLLALYDRQYRPRFSWILGSFGALIVIMFFANWFGEYPLKSFWSNLERMDGFVTLIHIFGYFVVLGSTLHEKRYWKYFLITSVVVAFFVALYGMAQYAGVGVVEKKVRIDSRLGNAAYMAIYMLFHVFVVMWLFVESKVKIHRIVYALLGLLFVFALIQTGTRGTTLGLMAGLATTAGYIGLFGARFRQFRNYALGIFALLIIAAGSLYAARDTEFVQSSLVLSRIANISIDDLSIRFTIWGMAAEGVKERPLLGWGQGNFSYVFNERFEPSLHGGEQWFDRVHNIMFDWLIAGGILGFLAYASIFVSCLYYLLWRPIFNKDDTFDVLERGVLVGLLAGYLTHNLVVFDNIISYIFFGTILAYLHARTSQIIPKIDEVFVPHKLITQMVAPIVIVSAGFVVYYVNVPNMQAASDIIDAFQASEPMERLAAFEQAFERESFANQEITEQLAQQAMSVGSRQGIDPEVREAYITLADEKLQELAKDKPGDARVHVFMSSFYRAIGDYERAKEQIDIARNLSLNKPSIIIQQAILEYSTGNLEGFRDYMKEAYELDTSNTEAQTLYSAAFYYLGDVEAARALVDDRVLPEFARTDFAVSAVQQSGDLETLGRIFEQRIKQEPNDPQHRASLAYIYNQQGDAEAAEAVLRQAAEDIPEFAGRANCFADNIAAGLAPEEGCE